MNGPREFTSTANAWQYLRTKATAIKAQEIRGKLANDIQLIRSRKIDETETVIPVQCGMQEEYFAKLENNGVWEHVFQNLTSLSDISSAYFSCGMFGEHLEKRRILMLLPQVFGVLQKNENLLYYPKDTRKDILKLRLVSKAWKEATEEKFLSPVGFSEPDWHLKKSKYNLMKVGSPCYCTFGQDEDVESAAKALGTGTSQSCSRLMRSVFIYIRVDGHDEYLRVRDSFFTKLQQLLDLYGEHVWALHFAGRYDYEGMWSLVSRMPNLKELQVDCWDSYWWTVGIRPTENDERRLIAQYPFPTISSLTRVLFYRISQCKILTAEILQRNPSIQTVSIEYEDPMFIAGLLPALAYHRLECFDFNLGEDARIFLHEIQPLRQMNWPLKVLNLSRPGEHASTFCQLGVKARMMFQILNRFNESLEEINLDAMYLEDDDTTNVDNVVVDFPHLKIINKVWICHVV